MIGDGDAVHAQGFHAMHQIGDAAGAVQQRIMGVAMKMNEVAGDHGRIVDRVGSHVKRGTPERPRRRRGGLLRELPPAQFWMNPDGSSLRSMTRDVVQSIESVGTIPDRDALETLSPEALAGLKFEGIPHGSAVGVQVLFDLFSGEELRPSQPLARRKSLN